MSKTQDSPIACTLPNMELAQRKEEIADNIWAGVTGRTEMQNGYEFTFPGTDEWAERLLHFVKSERQCCRFFLFEIAFAPDEGPITLRLSGADGTKQFIESMF